MYGSIYIAQAEKFYCLHASSEAKDSLPENNAYPLPEAKGICWLVIRRLIIFI
jgi:hypothetical protein